MRKRSQAREVAFKIINNDPMLEHPNHFLIRKELIKRTQGLVNYILLD